MKRLPEDLLRAIQSRLQPAEVATLSMVDQHMNRVARNPAYWAQKLARHFPEAFEPVRDHPLTSGSFESEYRYAYRVEYDGLTPAQKRLFNAVKDAAGAGDNYQIPANVAALTVDDLDNLADIREQTLLILVVRSQNQVLNDFCFNLVRQRFEEESLSADSVGRTLLHWAFVFNQTSAVVEGILDNPVAIDGLTSDGVSALYLAIHSGRLDMADRLLEMGASRDVVDPNDGSTVLHKLIADRDAAGADYLIQQRADLSLLDSMGFNPLMQAVKCRCDAVVDAILHRLDSRLRSASPATMTQVHNEVRNQYTMAMISAVFKQDMVSLEKLFHLSARPNVNFAVAGDNNSTALHYSAEDGNGEMVQFLLGKGALVNERLTTGETPLYLAACQGDDALASLLLEHGADLALAMKLAIPQNQVEVVACLLSATGQEKVAMAKLVMNTAAHENMFDILRVALDAGAPVNASEADGYTALHYVACQGYTELAELLIKRGANVNAKQLDGATPLHHAAGAGDIGLVRLLLNSGANANAKVMPGGQKPADYAGNRSDIRALLKEAKGHAKKRVRVSSDSENSAPASAPAKQKAGKRKASEKGVFSPSRKPNKRNPREPRSPQAKL